MDDFDGFNVGARLLEVRRAAGLSQRALAERASVPHGQISMVEQNRSSPSVASLRKILSGVPMTLAEFFEPDRPESDRVFFAAHELVDLTSRLHGADQAAPILFRQVGEARAHNLQILHERYAPGADTGPTMLEHNAHEGGVVLSGALEITVGTQKRVLGPGDAYLFDSRTPHRFRNIGDDDAVVISACTPPYL
ncbi:cupin domain-containing protein [Govanella unica]|uniref:Cupin domain-containing protein n=1 Tax=Govanella unica TaxID=2975056 RepID=A0A9X3Z7F5_9PROT|nr:cupin domain-containing protein [Govania unica]MDA5194190.1 cupin domain-containing protein [Govania unica]